MRPWSILPMCLLAAALAPDRAGAAEMWVAESSTGRTYLTVSGQIMPEDSGKFRALAASNDAASVLLASPGGSIRAAIEIGKIVRLKRMTTIVSRQGHCASACGLIWLAGERRLLEPKARVGFHSTYVYRKGVRLASAAGNALVGRYIAFLSLPAQALTFATMAGPEDIRWLDETNTQTAGIELELLGSDIETALAAPAGGSALTSIRRAMNHALDERPIS